MPIIDKRNLLGTATVGRPVEIELGCGSTKRSPHAIGIDLLDYDCVDVVGDVVEVLAKLPDASVSRAASSHFLEHHPDIRQVLDQLARVVVDGGSVVVTVPHFSNPYFYSDPTHRTAFGLYTFSYLCKDEIFQRKVPTYGIQPAFEITNVRLGFKSHRPHYLRHATKAAFGLLVNSTRWATEFYEENLCWLCPAYELTFDLRRLSR